MKIVHFTNIGEGCPQDLIPLKEVSKITGYKYMSLCPSNRDRSRIKKYCTIYKKGVKRTSRIYYSKSQVYEYMSKYNLVTPNAFNRTNYYTFKEISREYNISESFVIIVYSILKRINDSCPLDKYNILKYFSIKKTNYIEKNTVHKLFNILGYTQVTDKG